MPTPCPLFQDATGHTHLIARLRDCAGAGAPVGRAETHAIRFAPSSFPPGRCRAPAAASSRRHAVWLDLDQH
jgi:hypothetical protein